MNLKRYKDIILVCVMMLLAMTVALPSVAQDNKERRFNYFFLEAVRQQNKGNYTAAFDLLRHAKEIKPEAAEVSYMLSGYYMDLKNDSMARICFEDAVKLNPDNTTYRERLGRFYIVQSQYDKAIETYENLYVGNKEREDVLQVLYRLYRQVVDYPKMIETLNRMEELEGASEEITLTKMQVYEQQGEKSKVQKELRDLVEKHPYELNYRVMLGNWLLQNDKPEAALKEYKQVLNEDPDNVTAQMSMLDYYNMKGETDKGDELLNRLLSAKDTDVDTKIELLSQAIKNSEEKGGDSIKIMRLFDSVLAIPQKDSNILMLKAAYMALKKAPQDSINAIYDKAIAVEPDNVRARFLLIQAIWDKQDYDKVIEICRPAQQYNPDEMAFYYFQGLAHFQKDEKDEALETFEKGVAQIKPDSDPAIVSDFYAIMGDILHDKGLDEKAYEAYEKCLQWKEDNYGALNNYAYYLCTTGKELGKAEQMSYKTIKAEPANATFLDTYAWILFVQGRFEDAKIYIDETLKNDSVPSGVVLEHAGDIYAQTGNMDKAVDYWQQAVEKGNDSAVLQRKIKLRKYIKE